MALPQENQVTEAEHLTFERESDAKHEFTAGQSYAMTGASWHHNIICVNISSKLNGYPSDSPCVVIANGMRVYVAAESAFRYPDVVVVCGKPQFHDSRTDTIINPTVLIEVLSPSTALVDRNAKLREYRQLETLQAYLLISQNDPRVERFLRQDAQNWLYTDVIGVEAMMEIAPISCVLSLADVYRKVTFEDESGEALVDEA